MNITYRMIKLRYTPRKDTPVQTASGRFIWRQTRAHTKYVNGASTLALCIQTRPDVRVAQNRILIQDQGDRPFVPNAACNSRWTLVGLQSGENASGIDLDSLGHVLNDAS